VPLLQFLDVREQLGQVVPGLLREVPRLVALVLVQSEVLVLGLDLAFYLAQLAFGVLEEALHPRAVCELGEVEVAGLGLGEGLLGLQGGCVSLLLYGVYQQDRLFERLLGDLPVALEVGVQQVQAVRQIFNVGPRSIRFCSPNLCLNFKIFRKVFVFNMFVISEKKRDKIKR